MAITAYTAPEKHIAPEHDGVVRFRTGSDGRLTGGAVSISGSSFSINGGFWLINGRLVGSPSDTVAIPSGSGNYAYLIMTYDLNETPPCKFEVIRNNSAAMPTLTQQNLNNGMGTKYQMVLGAAHLVSGSWSRVYEMTFVHGKCIKDDVIIPASGWTADGDELTITLVPQAAPWPDPNMAIEAFPSPNYRSEWISCNMYLASIGVGTLTFKATSAPPYSIRANLRGF